MARKRPSNKHKSAKPKRIELPPEGEVPEDAVELPDDIEEIIEKHVPKDKRNVLTRFMLISHKHEGPLPPPSTLKGYDEALPGLAERIARQMELNGDHRRKQDEKAIELDRKMVRGYNFRGSLSLILAFFTIAGILVLATILAMKGFTAVAIALFTFNAGTIIAAFLRSRNKEELDANNGK